MSKPLDIEAIRKRCEAATEGPWKLFVDDTGDENTGWPLSVSRGEKSIVRQGGMFPYEWDEAISKREAVANGTFIAYARTDLPAALDEIERLRAALRGVLAVADRNTVEFDNARAALGVERKET